MASTASIPTTPDGVFSVPPARTLGRTQRRNTTLCAPRAIRSRSSCRSSMRAAYPSSERVALRAAANRDAIVTPRSPAGAVDPLVPAHGAAQEEDEHEQEDDRSASDFAGR